MPNYVQVTETQLCNVVLLVYLPSCLSQETAKWPLRSLSQCCHLLLTTSLTTQR